MISERTFIMKVFRCKSLDEVQEICIKRSEELDEYETQAPRAIQRPIAPLQTNDPVVAAQSPSMQRLMQQHPDLVPQKPIPTTSAAAMALQQRQALIQKMTGDGADKPENGRRAPRKI